MSLWVSPFLLCEISEAGGCQPGVAESFQTQSHQGIFGCHMGCLCCCNNHIQSPWLCHWMQVRVSLQGSAAFGTMWGSLLSLSHDAIMLTTHTQQRSLAWTFAKLESGTDHLCWHASDMIQTALTNYTARKSGKHSGTCVSKQRWTT